MLHRQATVTERTIASTVDSAFHSKQHHIHYEVTRHLKKKLGMTPKEFDKEVSWVVHGVEIANEPRFSFLCEINSRTCLLVVERGTAYPICRRFSRD